MKTKHQPDQNKPGLAFYDIHMHAFNLSHAGLLAFVNRFLINNSITFGDLLHGRYGKIVKNLFRCSKTTKALGVSALLLIAVYVCWIVHACNPEFMKSIFIPWVQIVLFGILALAALLLAFKIFRIKSKLTKKIRAVINTLSIFENDNGRQFRYAELDFLSLNQGINEQIDNIQDQVKPHEFATRLIQEMDKSSLSPSFKIGDTTFNKVIITPLVMDFGYKGFDHNDLKAIHYSLRPRKQVIEQTFDMFNGIKDYYNNHLFQILEIYPFLGINSKIYDSAAEIEKVLNSKFANYIEEKNNSGSTDRYAILNSLRRRFIEASTGENRTLIDTKNFYFAGIKLYPPLSYDPWPDNVKDNNERDKAKVIYDFCIKHNIPITTHCNDGGFTIDTKTHIATYTSPLRWEQVLTQEKYEKLKVNFAHFGGDILNKQHTDLWYKKVADLAERFENVYTDFSCMAFNPKDYRKLSKEIEALRKNYPKLDNKVMFGSDFPLCLLFGSESYLDYVRNFQQDHHLKNKLLYCHNNPERFLFG